MKYNNNYNEKGYHLMAKPVGPLCNLNCEYCFYTEKSALFPKENNFIMSYDVLEQYVKEYINSQNIPEISFVWQGGEPMLAVLSFYEKAVELQKKYANGKKILNSIQTNGTLLNDDWCKFLKENNFVVGLSLDGPEHIHNRYRKDFKGEGTFNKVMNGLELLKKYNIEYNVLACVAADTCDYPLKTYRFFKKHGVKHIQFTPVIERIPDENSKKYGLENASPDCKVSKVTDWSVSAEKYGKFLIDIFDEWVKYDVGEIFVMNFEWALTSWIGLENTMCIFAKECGNCMILEHNGDIYSCDHYMYPDYNIGNILKCDINKIISSEKQCMFKNKKCSLPDNCKKCEALFACYGECPRHRFKTFENGEYGKSYLCEGYKEYFYHIHPYMKAMAQLVLNGRPAKDVMTLRENPVVIFKK